MNEGNVLGLLGKEVTCVSGQCTRCGKGDLRLYRGMSLRNNSGIFKCNSCGHVESYNSQIIKSAFPIQKIQDGAIPYYLDLMAERK